MEKKISIDRETLNKIQWRSWLFQASFNYERMGGLGYCFTIIPGLKKLFPKQEDLQEATQRNIQLFNTTAQCVPFIVGTALSLEEEYANNKDFDPSSINALKVALMGPLAGIGDAFFQGVLRIIASAIGVGMVNNGNAMGVIVAFLAFNVPSLYLRIKGLYVGYKMGSGFLKNAAESNLMQKVSTIGSMVGLIVVGGMAASMLNITTSLEFVTNSGTISVQGLLDSIAPKLLPLGTFMLMYSLLKKKINVTYILFGTLILGILLTMLNIFSY
ncbi:MAG: fructoselysine/glucoselysine system component [Chloroflexota bacterium]|nr:fructoselysine/glucoselysine system component [Chloroflexota bacterium]